MTPKDLIKRYEKLAANRKTLDSHLQECADYILPRKNDINRTQAEGNKRGVSLYDSTAQQAAEILAGALHGMLTSPSNIWFEYSTGDEKTDAMDDVREWLHDATQQTHTILNNSNFQTEVHEFYLDEGWAGTACLSIEEDDDLIVRFSTWYIGEYFIDENDKGFIDTIFRKYKWTLRKCLQAFGPDALGEVWTKKAQEDPQQEVDLLYAVYPRSDEEKKGKAGNQAFDIAARHIFIKEERELRTSGFQEFPCAVARWTKASHETYGRSPAMKALADIKMLNEMMLTTLRGAQKSVDPAMMVPDGGFVLPIKTSPNAVNIRRSGNPEDRIEYLNNNARVDFGYQAVEDVRKRIREAFYVDQMQLAQGPQMTATEVNQRTEERLKLMGPMLGRQNSEFLSPLITRVFGIMQRRKLIPPPPQTLINYLQKNKKKKINVRFTSPIARAQKTSELMALSKVMGMLQPLVNSDPTVMDNFDSDKGTRYIAHVCGLPQPLLRDESDIKKIRAARADAQKKAQDMQDQQHQADIASKMGPAAAQVKQSGLLDG